MGALCRAEDSFYGNGDWETLEIEGGVVYDLAFTCSAMFALVSSSGGFGSVTLLVNEHCVTRGLMSWNIFHLMCILYNWAFFIEWVPVNKACWQKI